MLILHGNDKSLLREAHFTSSACWTRSDPCVFVCTDFFGKVPRGSKGVTALWPRGVLNEMIRNSQKSLFLDQFQIKSRNSILVFGDPKIVTFHCFWISFKSSPGTVYWSKWTKKCTLFTFFGPVSTQVQEQYIGCRGPKNCHFSLFLIQFQSYSRNSTLC